MANSILMPPILEFNYPSFDMEKDSVIFIGKLSINNNLKQVDHIQVKLLQQDDNKNGLNTELFPKNIYFIKNESEDIFYIKLNLFINNKSIFNNSKDILIPTFYKMQIRLGYKDETQLDKMYNESWGQQPPENWLEENVNLFSEWSNTSIIKTTFAPTVSIINLNEAEINNIDNPYTLFNATYVSNDSSENIESYKFELLDEDGIEIEVQDLNYVNDYVTPSINYQIKSYVNKETNYILKLTTRSNYGLSNTILYQLFFTGNETPFPLHIDKIIDSDNALNIIKIKYDLDFSNMDKILIKRLSISNNYNSYDDVYTINEVNKKNKDIYFKDYLINSDELYIYFLQIVYNDNSYSSLSEPIPIKNSYDYTYILGENGEQIPIYSPQINSITITKRNLITETIGQQFPYFQDVGLVDYKSFNFSGNITYLSTVNEENKIKTISLEELYGINAPEEIKTILKEEYGNELGNNYFTSIDYFVEKQYREKLIDFLKNGEIKVIKSPTERLLFTKFTNVNVTPKQELGRAIYDFSVTATEIFNEKNIDYNKYIFGDDYEL